MGKFSSIKIVFLLSLFFSVSVFAQTPQPSPTPPPTDDDVVKITTKLVQFDAVVTDKDGNQVRDLNIADFEVLQDGKPQKITNFSYINTESPAQSSPVTTIKNGKNVVLPPARVRPEISGRILTFIVDDGNCTASQIGMTAAREALIKFVNEQMLPNDLVSIYQTRGGSSLLQQYTSDKTQLMRAARRIRWYPPQGSCVSYNGDFFEPTREDSTGKRTGQGSFETDANRKTREQIEDSIRDNQAVGTIGVIRYVVRGLGKISGRKVVFLLSDGLPLRTREGINRQAFDALRDLTDAANRASVVFNTIDVRGGISYSPQGNDEGGSAVEKRIREVRVTRDGLFHLAEETGGVFYKEQNFLDVPIRRALSLEKGYYLIGYEPDDETFKSKDFNKIEIKLKRPDLKISSRAGFLGRTDNETAPKKRTGDGELYEAIVAPLPRAGLNVRLSAFFANDAAQGNVVRSLVHLDGGELMFVDDANGFKKAVFDVVAVTLNEKNEVVDEFNRTHTFKIEAAAMPLIKQNGLIYTTDVPIKKAGNYNFRLAVRDAGSKMLGSASQIIQVPDLKKSKIFLSGLTVSQVDANGKFVAPSAVKPENALSLTDSAATPAIRRFRPNSILAYAYTLYNARADKTTNQPKLTVQVNLYRDGKIISEGKPQTPELEKPSDPSRINDYGYLRLNANIEKGDYALQIIVKDLLTNETTSQWIDFEVGN
ncbi:MAG: VWA domain-containing protein [Acidobacteria bacterium]|nr:VWA domain-containing protein [Acidobacteriota bacterium]